MNTTSKSRAEIAASDSNKTSVLVWDAPVRVFHWLLVFCFAGAYLTAESEKWRLLHVTLGYTMAGLVSFRIVWGLIGTRYARFADFVRGPRAVLRYLGALVGSRPEHHTGHNPAGAFAVIALLGLALLVAATGWATYNEIGGDWFEELHEGAANLMLAIVGIHIAGVLLSSWLHRENLVRSMVTGRKDGRADEAIARPWWTVALLIVAAVAGFWWLQWSNAPTADNTHDQSAVSRSAAHAEQSLDQD